MKKIYILDDDVDFLELLQAVLGKNYVLSTNTGLDITAFSKFGPDLMLLDTFMGSVQGDMILWELENKLPDFSVPVFIMSGQDNGRSSFKMVKGFIPKPSSIKHIKKTLSDFFEETA